MRQRYRWLLIAALAACATALFPAWATAAPPPIPLFYLVKDLGTFGGSASAATDLNNNGQVVGWARNPNEDRRAFRYSNGVMSNLGVGHPDNPHPYSLATAINDLGQVVGWTTFDPHAGDAYIFLSNGGPLTVIDPPSPPQEGAWDINDLGQMVGWNGAQESKPRAWFMEWPYSELTMLNEKTQDGLLRPDSRASAINNNGWIAGCHRFSDTSEIRACLWEPFRGGHKPHDLGTLGGLESVAYDLNNVLTVVGTSDRANGVRHAFLWKPARSPSGSGPFGVMHDLGAFAAFVGEHSEAYGVNSADQVVGTSTLFLGNIFRAFVWTSSTGMIDLNSRIPSDSGWELYEATAINEVGQICGSGLHNGQRRAFLLTPVQLLRLY